MKVGAVLLLGLITFSLIANPVSASSNFPMKIAIEGDNVLWQPPLPNNVQNSVVPVGKDALVFIRSDIDSGGILEDSHPFKGFLLLKTPLEVINMIDIGSHH